MSEKITIKKQSVQETLVIPLYARKKCTEKYPFLFEDKLSDEIVRRIDYDFSAMEKKIDSFMGGFGVLEIAMRQTDLAYEILEYLKKNPKASVVNLGCGLDQTGESCDNGTCKIYNLDFEEVIAVRNEITPPGDRVKNLAVNLNDPSWFEEIDADNGVIFMGAGLFYYFTREQMEKLLKSMEDHFKKGVLVFDMAGKRAVKMMIKTWVQQAEIKDVNAYFYINDINDDLTGWLDNSNVSYRGYMLGYNDLKHKAVSGSYRLLAKIGDGLMKMKIVKIEFNKKKVI